MSRRLDGAPRGPGTRRPFDRRTAPVGARPGAVAQAGRTSARACSRPTIAAALRPIPTGFHKSRNSEKNDQINRGPATYRKGTVFFGNAVVEYRDDQARDGSPSRAERPGPSRGGESNDRATERVGPIEESMDEWSVRGSLVVAVKNCANEAIPARMADDLIRNAGTKARERSHLHQTGPSESARTKPSPSDRPPEGARTKPSPSDRPPESARTKPSPPDRPLEGANEATIVGVGGMMPIRASLRRRHGVRSGRQDRETPPVRCAASGCMHPSDGSRWVPRVSPRSLSGHGSGVNEDPARAAVINGPRR